MQLSKTPKLFLWKNHD